MDYKQRKIFNGICKIFNLKKDKITFIQYRNLKEFRKFEIERINPTHKIKLYGILKRKHIKDGHRNKMINVGEIIISIGLLIIPTNQFILNLLVSIAFYIFLSNLLEKNNILREVNNVNWNRGRRWKWKNPLPCKMS